MKFWLPRGAQEGCPGGVPRDAQEVKFGVPNGAHAEGWDAQRCPGGEIRVAQRCLGGGINLGFPGCVIWGVQRCPGGEI